MLPLDLDELTVRRLVHEDVADLLEIYSNPEVARFEFWEPWTVEQVEELIYSQSGTLAGDPGVPLSLAVVLKSENKVIGDCQITINSIEDRQGELGFTFNPGYSRRGFATKSVNATLGFGFIQLRLHRIMGAADVRNEPSWRLMERLGMRREAHFIHDSFVDGEWIDDYVYAILEDEWRARNATVSLPGTF